MKFNESGWILFRFISFHEQNLLHKYRNYLQQEPIKTYLRIIALPCSAFFNVSSFKTGFFWPEYGVVQGATTPSIMTYNSMTICRMTFCLTTLIFTVKDKTRHWTSRLKKHKNTLYSVPLCWVSQFIHCYAETHHALSVIMLNVVILNVVML